MQTLPEAADLVSAVEPTGTDCSLQAALPALEQGSSARARTASASWHVTKKLVIPANITLLPLPARSPELNPVENIWQFMRENWLGNRIFASYEVILDHCCDAWNKLIDQPWRIMSIDLRAWAHGF